MTGPIRVVIVDDSSLMREMLSDILSEADDIEVVGAAPDPYIAREMVKKFNPDVLTLDVEMPRMNGLAFLEKVMVLRPMPVVMISGLTQENSEVAFRALEIGAFDIISKSKINVDLTLIEKETEIIEKVRAAAQANMTVVATRKREARLKSDFVAPPKGYDPVSKIIAIGASAGGVEAIREILAELPGNCPGIVITQHMPANFTASFARRLDTLCAMEVRLATNGAAILPGRVYIADGDRHLEVVTTKAGYCCQLSGVAPVSGHRPSVDVLFNSMAVLGHRGVGVLLTGMGRDGAEGLLAMKNAGALTLGQDEATSMVYGMPRVAFEIGAACRQLPLRRMAEAILKSCSEASAGDLNSSDHDR